MPPVCVGGGAWRVAQAARSSNDKQEAGLNVTARCSPSLYTGSSDLCQLLPLQLEQVTSLP